MMGWQGFRLTEPLLKLRPVAGQQLHDLRGQSEVIGAVHVEDGLCLLHELSGGLWQLAHHLRADRRRTPQPRWHAAVLDVVRQLERDVQHRALGTRRRPGRPVVHELRAATPAALTGWRPGRRAERGEPGGLGSGGGGVARRRVEAVLGGPVGKERVLPCRGRVSPGALGGLRDELWLGVHELGGGRGWPRGGEAAVSRPAKKTTRRSRRCEELGRWGGAGRTVQRV